MSRFAYAFGVLPLAVAALAGCPSNESIACPPGQFYDSNTGQCFGQQASCPPGQTWNGQQCVAGGGMACPPGQAWNGSMCAPQQGGSCPAGQTWNGSACVAGGGLPNPFGASCSPAQPADQMTASAAGPGLNILAQQYAPGATATGSVAAGNFQPGQCIEVPVTLNPGKCYTAVATGAGPSEIDVMLAPNLPGPLAQPVAQDNTQGAMAVLGGSPNCFRSVAPFPVPMKLVLKVMAGQGNAAAQLYEK